MRKFVWLYHDGESITFVAGRTAHIYLDLRYRSAMPIDDGSLPLMLALSIRVQWRKAAAWDSPHQHRSHWFKCWEFIKPSEEIDPVLRLSLSMRGMRFWCDDYGAKYVGTRRLR